MANVTKRRWQFSLASLITLLIGCAVLFGFIVNMEPEYHLTIQCMGLPKDDEQLADWYREQGLNDVSVSRDATSIHVRYADWKRPFGMTMPPFTELGYAE